MIYTTEELIPVVAGLTDRFTHGESTSVTYDRANQLMRAVLYCIEEYERQGSDKFPAGPGISAAEAYQAGYRKVVRRTEAAGQKYSGLIAEFTDYGNRACRETVTQGLPAFFRKYDARFNPQEHFLTLDYPVPVSFGENCGIDLISDYIDCLALEQKFLRRLPESLIVGLLNRWRGDYAELFINIAGFTARNLLAAALAGKKNFPAPYTEAEKEKLRRGVLAVSAEALRQELSRLLNRLIAERYGGDRDLFRYLSADLSAFSCELKNAAEHDCMEAVISL